MKRKTNGKSWEFPDALWEKVKGLLPAPRASRKGGRPRLSLRKVLNGIFYVLRTGCQWKAVPAEFGSGSSLHRYFQEWVRRRVFRKMWKAGLTEYDELRGIQWEWQSLDGAMTKAPLGGEKHGSQPHGSWEVRHETLPAYRRRRRGGGLGGRRGQRPRQAPSQANAAGHGRPAPEARARETAASVR